MSFHSTGAAALLAACVLGASCASPAAQAPEAPDPAPNDTDLTLAVTIENDFFTGSDNNYTNAVALSLQTDKLRNYSEHSFARNWMEFWSFLPEVGDEQNHTYASWTIGQEMYTPNDIRSSTPAPDDQPYAGVLFLDSTLYALTPRLTHAWNIRLGIVGPSSQADHAQTEYHALIGADDPQGWDSQLPDEPILNLDYTLAGEWLSGELDGTASYRLVPMLGASLGNYFTGAAGGLYGEIGWNLPRSVGLLSIRRGVDSFATEDPASRAPWSLSFVLGAGGFAVAHYLPLDGTLFEDSPSVDSEPLVGFITTGLTWRNRWCTLAYLFTAFGESFETEIQNTEYGTLTASWTF